MRAFIRSLAPRRRRSHSSHPRTSRGHVRALVLPLALAGAFAAGAPAGGHAPPSTPEIRAEAIAEPSVMLIETLWKGYVHIPPNTVNVKSEWIGPAEAVTLCSGFVANPAGYVVTAGHCADNQSMTTGGKAALIGQVMAKAVKDGVVTESQAAVLAAQTQASGEVEGALSGSPPVRTVMVFQPSTVVSQSAGHGLAAQVVDFRGLTEGDVALLKVQSPTPMAAMQIAPATPGNGTVVIAAGYPGSVTQMTDTKVEPSFKTGSVSSARTIQGVPFIEISAPATPGMSGGPAFDTLGRVAGTVSFGPKNENQSFNFITDTSSVRSLLSRNRITNKLGPADLAYRAGLANYWAGHYHAAAADFSEAVTEDPDQASAQEYQAKSVRNYPDEVTAPFPWMWVGIGAGALILLAGGSVITLTVSRRRGRGASGDGEPAPLGAGPDLGPAPTGGQAPPAGLAPPEVPPAPVPPPAEQMAARGETAAGGETAPPAAPARIGERAKRFCPDCGTPHPADARFCEVCGHRFPVTAGSG